MGFNNHGAAVLAMRLARHTPGVPIGVNIGKTKTTPPENAAADYAESARLVGPVAAFLFGFVKGGVDVAEKTDIAEGELCDEDINEQPDLEFDG